MNDQLQYQIALTLAPQIGPVTAKTLVSYCGSAEAVWRAARRELLKVPGIGPATAEALRTPGLLQQAERELAFIEQHGIQAVFYTDPRYPVRLRQNADCPALLFFKGSSIDLLNAPRIVGIVGTRQPTDYGKGLCAEFVEELVPYNVVIVSGLAFGIDIMAHRQACAAGIPNIGALGHGLGSIYPSQHRSVAQKMVENGGLLSEYPHDTQPDREHFPMRNRIIAGLCDALLVVETAEVGGSMITAELAHQYGRELLAVPGRVRDPRSAGCNRLIKTGKAQLVENTADLADSLRWEPAGRERAVQTQLFPDLNPAEKELLGHIRQRPEIAIDELTATAQLPPGELASLLLALEFKGLLRTLPGKRYVLCG